MYVLDTRAHKEKAMSVPNVCDKTDNGEEDDEFEETTVLRRRRRCNKEISSRDSIIYKYDTLCHCEEECRCQVQQNLRESTAMEVIDTTTRRSVIDFMVKEDVVKGGMNLHSNDYGHYIEITDTRNKYPSNMALQNTDNILGINNQAVDQYHHFIVLEMFRNMIKSSTEEPLSLIVERQQENGNKEILEIEVNVEVEIQYEPIVKVDAHVCHSSSYDLNIRCVRYLECIDCRIHNGGKTNYYVTTDKIDNIHMRPLRHSDKKKNIFKCYKFHGLCMQRGRRPVPMFIGVFQSYEDNQFVMASSKTTLSLINIPTKLNTNMRQITRADPRFFVVSRTGSGHSYFESLQHRGSYWKFNENTLQLARRSNMEAMSSYDSHFRFVPVD
ncbi:uncharacterized protein LOC127737515 [Mytilus californianus]|uniref:uncharacterized protein LOC127737515 n=1 Tax=Mytilus californianus TaxID=6549 RepID=UPI002245E137|nr:uncharacterized protein LOC127737515 [Mytilus californianus]